MAGRNVEFVTTIPGRYALSVNDADMPTPKGWAWTLLTDVAQLESGHTPSRNHPEYWDGDIPWIGIKDARAHHGGVINDTLQRVTQAGIDNSAARILPAGTVCLSRTASVGYVVTMGRPMATSQDFVNWVCSPAIDPDYLKWIFRAEGEEGLRKFGKGTTHTTIYFPEVKAFHACIAPLNEQRRIVAKLDAIFEQTRVAKARLERLPALLEKLKRSILAAAFRGDLTADWRAAHPDAEPASALLDRIRIERRRRWETYLRAKGKDPSKVRYEEPEPADDEGLAALPDGWQWSTLAALTWDSSYGTSTKCDYDGEGEDVLRIPNVSGAEIDMMDRKRAVTPLALDPHDLLDRGDFLVVRTNGSRDLIGRAACLVDNTAVGCYFASYLIRFRVVDAALGRWLSLWWRSPFMRRWLEQRAATSAGQYNISLSTLATAPVPVAGLEEQSRLTDIVEQALMVVKVHASRFERTTRAFVLAEQAALAKAFHGELVPQDPNDEPAAVLLERIRATRADVPQRPGGDREPRPTDALTSSRNSNGHRSTARGDDSLDLVVAALQQGEPRLTAVDIAEATNLDAPAVKQVLKTLIAAGQVRVHGRARGTSYEWIA